jgi:hypothetical protein
MPVVAELGVIVSGSNLARFMTLKAFRVGDLTVPRGFISDGESVPWFARWLFPRASRALPASIAHDYRMVTAGTIEERKQAHKKFQRDLETFGVPAWRAYIMSRAAKLADDRL